MKLLTLQKFSREISGQIIDFVDNLTKSEHDIFFLQKNFLKKLIDKPLSIILV